MKMIDGSLIERRRSVGRILGEDRQEFPGYSRETGERSDSFRRILLLHQESGFGRFRKAGSPRPLRKFALPLNARNGRWPQVATQNRGKWS